MIKLEKITQEKCHFPHLLRRPAPAPYFHTFLKFFRVPPSRGGNQNFLPPPPPPPPPPPHPPLLRTPAPAPYFHPPSLIFQIPSTLGKVIKIYFTSFKKGGVRTMLVQCIWHNFVDLLFRLYAFWYYLIISKSVKCCYSTYYRDLH